jgi:hypothetical protein
MLCSNVVVHFWGDISVNHIGLCCPLLPMVVPMMVPMMVPMVMMVPMMVPLMMLPPHPIRTERARALHTHVPEGLITRAPLAQSRETADGSSYPPH